VVQKTENNIYIQLGFWLIDDRWYWCI